MRQRPLKEWTFPLPFVSVMVAFSITLFNSSYSVFLKLFQDPYANKLLFLVKLDRIEFLSLASKIQMLVLNNTEFKAKKTVITTVPKEENKLLGEEPIIRLGDNVS